MPVKAAPIVAAAYDWSGVYLGVHAGYGGGMKDWDARNADFVARGFLAGGQVGINKQISSFVFGLELDGSWADISGSQFVSVGSAALGITSSQTARSKIDGLVDHCRPRRPCGRSLVRFCQGWHHRGARASFDGCFRGRIWRDRNGYRQRQRDSLCADGRLRRRVRAGRQLVGQGRVQLHPSGHDDDDVEGHRDSRPRLTAPFRADAQIEEAIHVVKVGVNYRFGGVAKDPSYAPVPAAPGTNWSGAYIGAQAGYGFGRKHWPDLGQAVDLTVRTAAI